MRQKPPSEKYGIISQLMTRRDFITRTVYTAIGIISLKPLFFQKKAAIPTDTNTLLCIKKFAFAVDNTLAGKPIGDVVATIGGSFVGTDYQENTLDKNEAERLVVNLQGFDCVTLCENTLAFARCIKSATTTVEEFCRQLQYIRYRAGVIETYASRLHYFSDWIFDNVRKDVVDDVTADIGGSDTEHAYRCLNFMTTHRESYRQLDNETLFAAVQKKEQEISRRMIRYIPKGMIDTISTKIHHGDIIAFTTNVEGMDVSHTGIAFKKEDTVHLLHAPIPGKKVQITELSLHEYCAKNSRQTGIIIARPLEPCAL
jgi:hypothetical protein